MTSTPASGAFDAESVTCPVIVAVPPCAAAVPAKSKATSGTRDRETNRVCIVPPGIAKSSDGIPATRGSRDDARVAPPGEAIADRSDAEDLRCAAVAELKSGTALWSTARRATTQ